jgi:uncharacterized HhH-GPD family protein
MGFQMTGDPAADEVLDEYPFAVVVGMMLDQQYGMEHAFRGGYKVLERFGSLDPATIAAADPEEFKEMASTPPAIHRFPGSMSGRLQELAALVQEKYDGDVTRLWTEATSGQDLLRRVQDLPGFGKQKAQIFVALLAKQLGVRPDGWEEAAGDYALEGLPLGGRRRRRRLLATRPRVQEAEEGSCPGGLGLSPALVRGLTGHMAE